MGRVSWLDQAESDLDSIAPAVKDQLRRNAEEILHDIAPRIFPTDEGAAGGIMWHRCITHEQDREIEAGRLPEQADGPQNYFLIYRKRNPAPGFEVLAVRSIGQIASMWVQMSI